MGQEVFLKMKEDGAYKKTKTLEEADFVRVPADEFVSLTEWNSLIDEYQLLQVQLQRQKNADETAQIIRIPIEEYHGYQNCLRILRDRALQQIDKAQADKYGYTLKYADRRMYDRAYPNLRAYFITKVTPISLKVDFETAFFLIRKDLQAFYNYVKLPSFAVTPTAPKVPLTARELLLATQQKEDQFYSYDFYVDNSDKGRQIKAFLDGDERPIIFEMIKVGSNIGQGVYEVSYWATGPI